jgi:cation diffusion facilitator CzcD-associated flavoprotein CzcO
MFATAIAIFTIVSLARANNLDKFDFVIVGAGTGGTALAARLSENKNWSVLLL